MRWPARGPGLRRLALALATAQLVAYALAPVIEARTERAPGPPSVEQNHTSHCVKIHQPATCLACQLVSLRARVAERARLPLRAVQRAAGEAEVRADAAPRALPRAPQSRAPPRLVA